MWERGPQMSVLDDMTAADASKRGGGSLWDARRAAVEDMTVDPDDLKILGGGDGALRDLGENRSVLEMEAPELYAKSFGELLQEAQAGSEGAVPDMLEAEDVEDARGFKFTPGTRV